jgi:hypothetical protein
MGVSFGSILRVAALAVILCAIGVPSFAEGAEEPAAEGDRHAGYYYPDPVSREVYQARAQPLAEASRRLRVGFVTGFTKGQLERPVPLDFALFAKGGEAEKMIIVGLDSGRLNTIYRARAFLAMLTAVARAMPIFAEYGVQDTYTFFDLARMLGFTQITVSDGETFAHQIILE